MSGRQHSRISALELNRLLEGLLDSGAASPEAEYRIRKLMSRTMALADKMFVKTVKGQELIAECMDQARLLQNHVGSGGQSLYRRLTELENIYEELLKKTYEFRIKAG